jgi:penicillin-binding protein 1A
MLAVCGALALAAAWWTWDLWRGVPGDEAIRRIGDVEWSTIVFDAAGRAATTLSAERRIEVPLERVSTDFLRALVAIEDRRFYVHGAVDPRRMAAAAMANLTRGRAAQGASTLTQQLARASFLTPRKTLRRKLQEMILAARIERQYSKARILELYVNRVYFGAGLWGVEAASLGYFGTHASSVTLAEAALLAGLVQSPSSDAPTVDPDRALRRRALVLQAMFETGAIDRRTLDATSRVPLRLTDAHREPLGGYFFEEVRKSLVERYGSETAYTGGLRVYSTIDLRMQAAADAAVASSLLAIDQRRSRGQVASRETDPLQAALIAIDPRTGEVRALVGGRRFSASQFDRAMQAYRQPGSAFKPFVYAAALESGYTGTTVIDRLDEPLAARDGAWLPDDEHSDATSLDVRSALRISSNRAAVRVLDEIGVDRIVRYARAFGMDRLPAVPSLALGSGEVTLATLTAAYAAFANGGLLRKPLLIRHVDGANGERLMTATSPASRAITRTTAYLMSDMLADVINSGTGARARSLGFTLPAAGKTGTTNGFNDAWFVGYTPTLVAGVWVGFDTPHTIMRNGFAADVAVPLWTAFMTAATRGDAPAWFTSPEDAPVAAEKTRGFWWRLFHGRASPPPTCTGTCAHPDDLDRTTLPPALDSAATPP